MRASVVTAGHLMGALVTSGPRPPPTTAAAAAVGAPANGWLLPPAFFFFLFLLLPPWANVGKPLNAGAQRLPQTLFHGVEIGLITRP
jgi:hypothetical protein